MDWSVRGQAKTRASGYEFESELSAKRVRLHVNRLRRIGPEMVETRDPEDGVFSDNLRLLKRIKACENRKCRDSDATERWFKARVHGRRPATILRHPILRGWPLCFSGMSLRL